VTAGVVVVTVVVVVFGFVVLVLVVVLGFVVLVFVVVLVLGFVVLVLGFVVLVLGFVVLVLGFVVLVLGFVVLVLGFVVLVLGFVVLVFESEVTVTLHFLLILVPSVDVQVTVAVPDDTAVTVHILLSLCHESLTTSSSLDSQVTVFTVAVSGVTLPVIFAFSPALSDILVLSILTPVTHPGK
jgi:hypothetical protein